MHMKSSGQEGACDLYREFARHGGIGSDFVNAWYPLQVAAVQHGLGNFGQVGKVSGDYLCGPEILPQSSSLRTGETIWKRLKKTS